MSIKIIMIDHSKHWEGKRMECWGTEPGRRSFGYSRSEISAESRKTEEPVM